MSAAQTSASPERKILPHRTILALVIGLSFLLAACGGGEEGTSVGVASLEDVAVADSAETDDAAADAAGEVSADEAVLEFSQCMRDAGLDFPDIGIDADGNPNIRDAFGDAGIDRRDEDVEAALTECRPLIEAAGFGGGGRAGLADNVEVADALIEFSDCVRDDGWDVGDLELGGGPGAGGDGAPAAGEGDGEGAGGEGRGGNAEGGQRGDGFRDPTARFARGLGLDPEDPDVQATMEKCQPIITEAFTAAGIGRN